SLISRRSPRRASGDLLIAEGDGRIGWRQRGKLLSSITRVSPKLLEGLRVGWKRKTLPKSRLTEIPLGKATTLRRFFQRTDSTRACARLRARATASATQDPWPSGGIDWSPKA